MTADMPAHVALPVDVLRLLHQLLLEAVGRLATAYEPAGYAPGDPLPAPVEEFAIQVRPVAVTLEQLLAVAAGGPLPRPPAYCPRCGAAPEPAAPNIDAPDFLTYGCGLAFARSPAGWSESPFGQCEGEPLGAKPATAVLQAHDLLKAHLLESVVNFMAAVHLAGALTAMCWMLGHGQASELEQLLAALAARAAKPPTDGQGA